MKRRRFFQNISRSALVLPSTVMSPAMFAPSTVLGANDRIQLGLIGCGGRGRFIARHLRHIPTVRFVSVCDVYQKQIGEARALLEIQSDGYGDFRHLLERKDIDAVVVATPDHWHAAITVLACQAEKDVYVEKPLAHNIREGRTMVQAARRHNRIVQTGTQQRSAGHIREIQALIQRGDLGRVRFIRIWNYRNMTPNGIGKKSDSPVPAGLDWDFYLGPAPKVPFNRNRFLSTFRWFWDYSGGVITDYGTHRFDSMQQIMDVQSPRSVTAVGQRFELDDGGEIPDVLQATYDYGDFVVSYEACVISAQGLPGHTSKRTYYNSKGEFDRPNGMAFYGTKGALFADRFGYEIYPDFNPAGDPAESGFPSNRSSRYRTQRIVCVSQDAAADHTRNFIACIRSRKKPHADVEIGHHSTIVPHLGNIAYKTGRKILWDADMESIIGDREAQQLLYRQPRKGWDLIQV